MLAKLELYIEYQYKEKLSYQISSNMHGIIMDLIDTNYADELHKDGRKPFHQYIRKMTENNFLWVICTLNQEAKEKIIDILATKNELYMRHKDLKLYIVRRNLSVITYEELIQKYYFQEQPRDITIQFMTPTAFKSHGKYVFIPDTRFIFQSLLNKYDSYSTDTKVGGVEIVEHFEQYSFIKKYRLNSVRFALEGIWISAFLGEVTIHINGPSQMVNLAHMLAAYGEYAGVGIKCSLGMGSIMKKERILRDR